MRGVLLTGLPGVGKSTACRRIAELCAERGYRVEGFITEELREHRQRVGFDVVELGRGPAAASRRVPLARLGEGPGPRVGRYSVTLKEFESLALPLLERIEKLERGERVVCIIDEIGKMELYSNSFVSHMRSLLKARSVPMLCTIALHGGGFIAEAKRTAGHELIEITQATRDAAPEEIIAKLLGDMSLEPARQLSATHAEKSKASARSKENDVPSVSNKDVPKPAAVRRWQVRPKTEEAAPVKSQQSAGRIVLWLRNDLRLADNPLFQRGIAMSNKSGASLQPVFCYDPRDFGPEVRTQFDCSKIGDTRRQFLEASLFDLAATLEKRQSCLLVYDAAPEKVLPELVRCGDTVLVTREACTEELAAEARVKEALRAVGANLDIVDDGGITTLFGANELRSAGLGEGSKFVDDFRIFYDAVKEHVPQVCREGLWDPPDALPSSDASAASSATLMSFQRVPRARAENEAVATCAASPEIRGGETAARGRLKSWLAAGGLRNYKGTFRRLLGDYSSRLSASLALGCISPRRVCFEALVALPRGPHIDHFVYEMCWRDFFRHVARRWGSSMFLLGGPLRAMAKGRGKSFGGDGADGSAAWRRDPDVEERWRRGLTGVPLVDAAMRELKATGYMGNLARQFAAAFLVEDLKIDWRVGASWFECTLLDYDPHSNWGQWARSAGVAPTNEAKRQRVGGTRYFDLALRLDDGAEAVEYVRTWLPELRGFAADTGSAMEVLAPWRYAAGGTAALGGYPSEPVCSAALRRYFEDAASGSASGAGGKASGGGGGKGRGQGWKGSRKGQGWRG